MADLIHTYDIEATISIDGPEDIHNLNRVDAAGNGSFSKVVRGIELLNQAGSPSVLLEATYTMKHKELGYTWDDIREYLRNKFNTDNVMIANCLSGGADKDLAFENDNSHIQDIDKAPFPNVGFTIKNLYS